MPFPKFVPFFSNSRKQMAEANSHIEADRWIQRMLLVVDIHLLHGFCNDSHFPTRNLIAIQDASEKLLSSCDHDKTLYSFKLFDSALSPYKSNSYILENLGRSAAHSAFDTPSETREFFKAIRSVRKISSVPCSSLKSRAHFLVRSLQELFFHYSWDPHIMDESTAGKTSGSNLAILFCSLPQSKEGILEFCSEDDKQIEPNEACESGFQLLLNKFTSLRESFRRKNIDFCCIDVHATLHDQTGKLSNEMWVEAFEKLGWRYFSIDTIVAGSRLLPFSLIWRSIAYSNDFISRQPQGRVELLLELEDVNGNPLFCKACELQYVALENSAGSNLKKPAMKFDLKEAFSLRTYKRIHVTNVFQGEPLVHFGEYVSRKLLLFRATDQKPRKRNEKSFESGVADEKKRKNKDSDIIGDEILKRLQQNKKEFNIGKPVWPLLLVFLARRNCFALVEVMDTEGYSFYAVIQPLSAHTAILHVLRYGVSVTMGQHFNKQEFSEKLFNAVNCGHGKQDLNKSSESAEHGMVKSDLGCNKFSSNKPTQRGSESIHASPSLSPVKLSSNRHLKRKISQKLNTWDSFYLSLLRSLGRSGSNLDSSLHLETRFLKRNFEKSKILKFLELWMKKMSKSLVPLKHFSFRLVQQENNSEEDEKLKPSSELGESSQPIAQVGNSVLLSDTLLSSSDTPLDKAAGLTIDAVDLARSEPSKSRASASEMSLDERIQQGLCNEEIDLQALVKLAVGILIEQAEAECETSQLSSSGIDERSENATKTPDCYQFVQMILKTPRELAMKYKDCLPPVAEQETSIAKDELYTSENKVREHEFQILLRLEVLASGILTSSQAHVKQKLKEEICELLDNVQFNLPGGIFDGETLHDFANRVIASRYDDSLKSVVDYIYKVMEFESDDNSDSSLHSISDDDNSCEMDNNESHKSSQNQVTGDTNADERNSEEKDREAHISESPEVGIGSSDSLKNRDILEHFDHDYRRRLMKAKEKRERAWRIAHFTSRVRDLQRVWAPKRSLDAVTQQAKSDRNQAKERDRPKDDNVVLETPMKSSKTRKRNDGSKNAVLKFKTGMAADIVNEMKQNSWERDISIAVASACEISVLQHHVAQPLQSKISEIRLEKSSDYILPAKNPSSGSVSRTLFQD